MTITTIILAIAVLILSFTAFTGGLLLGVTSTREDKNQNETDVLVIQPTQTSHVPAAEVEPLLPAADAKPESARTGAWEQIAVATLCKSPSPDNLYILVDPFDTLAEIWLLTCLDGEDEAYRVSYLPTVSGMTTTVTKMARP